MGGPSTTFVHDTPRPLSLVSSNNHLLCFCLDLSLSRTPHSLLPYLTFFAVYLLNLLIMHASLIALAASLSVASAVTRGFNYGAVTREGAMKNEAAFTAEFNAAKGLANTDGAFSSARLYTMIQSGTDNSPISAIPAAIATDTKLFLGLWASAGQTIIDNEIAALTSAIEQYGEEFTSRVNGISVGSEDLTVSRQLVSRTTQPELEPDQHRSSATFNKLERTLNLATHPLRTHDHTTRLLDATLSSERSTPTGTLSLMPTPPLTANLNSVLSAPLSPPSLSST